MTTLQTTSVIPPHPNIVEMIALLEDPHLRARERTDLRRLLHDTMHFVQKQDGTVQQADSRSGQPFWGSY